VAEPLAAAELDCSKPDPPFRAASAGGLVFQESHRLLDPVPIRVRVDDPDKPADAEAVQLWGELTPLPPVDDVTQLSAPSLGAAAPPLAALMLVAVPLVMAVVFTAAPPDSVLFAAVAVRTVGSTALPPVDRAPASLVDEAPAAVALTGPPVAQPAPPTAPTPPTARSSSEFAQDSETITCLTSV
jgi:hypothetical protein